MFKLALIQMHVQGGNRSQNLRHARELIGEAATQGSQVVLLPEAMDLGWTHPAARSEATPVPEGEVCRALSRAAAEHRVYLCSGLTEKAGNEVFNTAVILDPEGQVIARHRKLNELAIGHAYYAQGDRLNVCRTDWGTFGLMICADGFAQDRVLSRALGYMGAEVILSPCAWAVDADHDNVEEPYGQTWRQAYIPVAREFSMWIVGVSNVGWISGGPWQGKKCIGCSLVVGPEGREILQGPYGAEAETILYVDVDPVERPARGCDWAAHWKRS